MKQSVRPFKIAAELTIPLSRTVRMNLPKPTTRLSASSGKKQNPELYDAR
jgi:hypothetical protein